MARKGVLLCPCDTQKQQGEHGVYNQPKGFKTQGLFRPVGCPLVRSLTSLNLIITSCEVDCCWSQPLPMAKARRTEGGHVNVPLKP